VHLVKVGWARPGSGFTMLFEVALLTYAKQMPVAPLAAMAREHDTRVWRVLEHHVATARAGLDFSEVTQVGMDETSARRGQDYVSVIMDLAERRVLFATEGRDADTVKQFAADLAAHGGAPRTQLDQVCCDMSPAFIKGVREHLSEHANDIVETTGHCPQIVFDRYHVVAKANEAVDEVRRAEAKTRPELKRTRYAWLKNEANLSAKQREQLAWLTRPSMQLQTTRAARWRDDFNGFYNQPTPTDLPALLVLPSETLPAAAGQGLRPSRRSTLGRHRCLDEHPDFPSRVRAIGVPVAAADKGQEEALLVAEKLG